MALPLCPHHLRPIEQGLFGRIPSVPSEVPKTQSTPAAVWTLLGQVLFTPHQPANHWRPGPGKSRSIFSRTARRSITAPRLALWRAVKFPVVLDHWNEAVMRRASYQFQLPRRGQALPARRHDRVGERAREPGEEFDCMEHARCKEHRPLQVGSSCTQM